MKKTVIALISALALGSALNFAAAKEESIRDVIDRTAKKEKTEKLGKKEAKIRTKAGWVPMEGSLPLEKQFDNAFAYDLATDEDEQPYFFTGQAEYTANNKGNAYIKAHKAAVMQLISNMENNAAGGGSLKISDIDGVTSTEGSDQIKNIFAKKLEGIQPVVKIYKKEGKDYSVMVRLFYSRKQAAEVLRQELAKKVKHDNKIDQKVDEQLDKLLEENK